MIKKRTVLVVLIISLIFNIVGIVFTALYFQVRKRVQAAKKESSQYLTLYTAARTQALADMDKPGSAYRRDFVSHLDGEADSYLIWPPLPQAPASVKDKGYTLVVYLHGMGSSAVEPFVFPEKKPFMSIISDESSNAVLASLSYRKKASWGNEAALADINQNINEMMQAYPVRNIIVAGMSMGGCVSLAYSVLAPDEIRQKIKGVMCIEGAAELSELYKATQAKIVKDAMVEAFKGTPESNPAMYKQMSFLEHIDKLKPDTRVAIIYADHDTTVPGALSQQIAAQISNHRIPTKLIEVHGGHTPPGEDSWRQAFHFLLTGK